MAKINLPSGESVLVDDVDLPLVKGFRWFLIGGFARATVPEAERRRTLTMHRLILGVGPGEQVDHVSRDKLENRRPKFRLAHLSQQKANTAACWTNRSGHKGVSFHKPTGTWQAQIH